MSTPERAAPLKRRDWGDIATCIDQEDMDKRYRVHDIDPESRQEGVLWDVLTCRRCGEDFKVSPKR